MNFSLGKEFTSWAEIVEEKRRYEEENNVLITVGDSHKILDGRPNSETLVYERIRFICKAGSERKCESQGVRLSSTGRMNCPFDLRIGIQKGSFHYTRFFFKFTNYFYFEFHRKTSGKKIH